MSLVKKMLAFIAAIGFVALLMTSSNALAAPATPPTTPPACDGTFPGLPSWHKYLPKDATLRDPATGEPTSDRKIGRATCEIKLEFYDPSTGGTNSLNKLWLIGAAAIEILMRLGGLIAIIWIMKAGVEMTISNGNPDAIKSLRQKIIYTGAGLTIIIIAQGAVGFMASKIDSSGTISSGNVDFLVPTVSPDKLVADAIQVAFQIIGAVSLLMVVVGGIKMVFSQGEPANFTKAKNTIIYAIAGVVVSLSAYSIVGLIVTRL